MTRQVPEQIVITTPHPVLLVAFELSSKTWKLAFGDRSARKGRVCAVEAWGFKSLARELKRARHHFGLPDDCPVLVCMEAVSDSARCGQHAGGVTARSDAMAQVIVKKTRER